MNLQPHTHTVVGSSSHLVFVLRSGRLRWSYKTRFVSVDGVCHSPLVGGYVFNAPRWSIEPNPGREPDFDRDVYSISVLVIYVRPCRWEVVEVVLEQGAGKKLVINAESPALVKVTMNHGKSWWKKVHTISFQSSLRSYGERTRLAQRIRRMGMEITNLTIKSIIWSGQGSNHESSRVEDCLLNLLGMDLKFQLEHIQIPFA